MPKHNNGDRPARLTDWQAWRTALTNPDMASYGSIARNPNITMMRALLWMGTGWFLSALLNIAREAVYPSDMPDLSLIICAGAIVLPIEFTVLGITHAIAGYLGGAGRFDEFIRPVAAFIAPIMIIRNVIFLIPIPVLHYAIYILSVYQLGLTILSVNAVHRIGWYKATVASFLFVLSTSIFVASGFRLAI